MLAEDMADMNLDCGYAPDSDQAVQIKFMQKEIKEWGKKIRKGEGAWGFGYWKKNSAKLISTG